MTDDEDDGFTDDEDGLADVEESLTDEDEDSLTDDEEDGLTVDDELSRPVLEDERSPPEVVDRVEEALETFELVLATLDVALLVTMELRDEATEELRDEMVLDDLGALLVACDEDRLTDPDAEELRVPETLDVGLLLVWLPVLDLVADDDTEDRSEELITELLDRRTELDIDADDDTRLDD